MARTPKVIVTGQQKAEGSWMISVSQSDFFDTQSLESHRALGKHLFFVV